MRVAIRVDASNEIGTGHFVRCLTLADALRQRGAIVRFISRHLPEYLRVTSRDRGHEVVAIAGAPSPEVDDDLPHSHFLGTSQAADVEHTAHAVSDHSWDWMIVDHYGLDAQWEHALGGVARRILVIDDLADRRHDCHVLLDQNLYADMHTRYRGLVPESCVTLLGPGYAILREEFRRARAGGTLRPGPIERVLVFFGGVDVDNYTARAIEALIAVEIPELRVDVVIGVSHPHRRQIESACAAAGFACHVQTDRMAELMAAADVAIGAGGSASWERCCLGLPTICVTTAAHQRAIGEGLQARGALVMVPAERPVTAKSLSDAVSSLVRHPDRVRSMSCAARELVDGVGVDRVCDRLMQAA